MFRVIFNLIIKLFFVGAIPFFSALFSGTLVFADDGSGEAAPVEVAVQISETVSEPAPSEAADAVLLQPAADANAEPPARPILPPSENFDEVILTDSVPIESPAPNPNASSTSETDTAQSLPIQEQKTSTSTVDLFLDATSTIDDAVSIIDNAPILTVTDAAATTTPNISEQLTDNGKIVTVSSPDESDATTTTNYVNVPVRSEIPEIFKVGRENKIKIKWTNNGNEEMQFQTYDDDNDGLIDHVGWIVPHLSTQTFEIVYISKALKLDADKNTIEDIYDLLKSQDQNYANISDGQYVRVTFEKKLDSARDITLYARPGDANSTASYIEVYTQDGQPYATFENIDHDGKYRIILANLQTPTDVFD